MTAHDDAWRVRVTSRDIRAAAEAWWLARVSGASPERLLELWDDLLRLRRAQAVQRVEDGVDRRDGSAAAPGSHASAGGARRDGGAGAALGRPAPDGVVPHQR